MGQERKKEGVINVAHSGTSKEKGRGDKCGALWDKMGKGMGEDGLGCHKQEEENYSSDKSTCIQPFCCM